MKRKFLTAFLCVAMVATMLTGCSSGAKTATTATKTETSETVTIEFAQWWEPELPAGSFRKIMDEFEAGNPGIKVKLVSGPYSNVKQQLVAGAAAGTMSDVVGLDGAWVSDFVKQGAITSLTDLMTSAGYDKSQLASQVQLKGSTYMIPIVNFVYPLFVNLDLMKKAGIEKIPATRSEFVTAAKKFTNASSNTYGWILPLSMQAPNGIQNDVMSWLWASGGSMMKDGAPDLTNKDVRGTVEFVKGLSDDKVISLGASNLAEQDKVEEFTNGRVGMMVDSLAHINTIRKSNPNLNFAVAAIPSTDNYTGKKGMPYASWGIGVSESSKHKAEAWKLVSFLMSEKVNSEISTLANAFPGNVNSKPDFTKSDKLFAQAFDIYKSGYPANEFVGLPVAEDLMRMFDEQLQLLLSGKQTVDETLNKAQTAWKTKF